VQFYEVLHQNGMSGVVGGKPFVEQLRHVAKDAKAIISWGCCASRGCVQAAKPNPTQATPSTEATPVPLRRIA
jgi:hydrogenase small subunit